MANDTTTNLPNAIAEGDDISTADSEIDVADSLPNEDNGNITYDRGDTQPDASYSMDDGNGVAEDAETTAKLDAAADGIDKLDVQIDTEKEVAAEPAPEVAPEGDPMGGGEVPAEGDPMAAPDGVSDVDLDAAAGGLDDLGLDGGDVPAEGDPMGGGDDLGLDGDMGGDPMGDDGEVPTEGGENTEETKREIKSKVGEVGELVRDNPIADDANVAVEVINQFVEPFNTENMEHGDQQKIINKIKGDNDDMGGEPAEVSIDDVPAENGELPVPEPDVPELEGQPALEEKEVCDECGTFEQYSESRGYNSFVGATIAEVANVINGYVSAFNEGMNDGDFIGVAPYLTEGVRKELMEYGQRPYLVEAVKKKKTLNEAGVSFGVVEVPQKGGVEDLTEEELNELGWRDIKNAASGIAGAGKYVGNKAQQAVGQAQQGMMDKVQQAGNYVGDKTRQAGQAVKGELGRMGQDVKQAGQWVGDKAQTGANKVAQAGQQVKQQYHKGAGNRELQSIQQDAMALAQNLANFNVQAQKAGQEDKVVNPRNFFMKLANKANSGMNISGMKMEGVTEGGEDYAALSNEIGMEAGDLDNDINTGDDLEQATFAPEKEKNGFAPQQTLGVGSGKLGVTEGKLRKYIQNRLAQKNGGKSTINESKKSNKLKQLDMMIDEQWELANKINEA